MALSWLLAAVAFVAAGISGVTGLGGGTILIAALYAVGLAPIIAVPLHAAVQLASNFSRTIAYVRHVNWHAAGWFLLGCVPAPFIVAPWVAKANVHVIQVVMAGFVLLAIWPAWREKIHAHGRGGLVFSGLITGGLGMILGATGLLIAPFFLREEWSKSTVIGTLAFCQTLGHLFKIVGFAAWGFAAFAQMELLLPMVLAVFAGTFAGKYLGKYLPEPIFRTVFQGIMGLLAVKLLYDGVTGLLM